MADNEAKKIDSKTVLTPYIKSLLLEPPNLTPDDLGLVIKLIVQKIPTEVQIASFLTALRLRGLDQQAEYIAVAASKVLEYSDVLDPSRLDAAGYIDIVGTGGDGQNTFNVSTSSAIVCAGMGLKVCKHGGKAATSSSGAGDLMANLGADLSVIKKDKVYDILSKSNFCFLFAPNFHPAMANVAPLRSALGIPTIFNVLGPLLNPAPIRARILGVYAENLGMVYAEAVLKLDKERGRKAKTMVVWGQIGLDEISPIGRTKIWLVDPATEEILPSYITPKDFDLKEHTLDQVLSGTPSENAALLKDILNNKLGEGDPIYDYITMNAGALAFVSGQAASWKHGKELAIEAIKSGNALKALNQFIDAI